MDTTTQREQLAQVLATHRTHHTDNESWILTNYVEHSGKEWPETVVLHRALPSIAEATRISTGQGPC